MPPAAPIPCRWRDGALLPAYLSEADHPWLRRLLDDHAAFVGRRRREWEARLEEPGGDGIPEERRRWAARVLAGCVRTRCAAGVRPCVAREAVFGEAARGEPDRDRALSAAAARLGVDVETLDEALFADLPGEQRVGEAVPALDPAGLALRANLALVRALLQRAASVRIEACGHARTLVSYARLRGLICTVRASRGERDAVLELSGPFALFRRTHLYGRALADLVPHLAWCRSFRLEADCEVRGRRGRLALRSGDPFLPSAEPRRFDSAVEAHLARDLARLAPEWDAVREPEPVPVGDRLLFPDFLLRHRHDPRRRWWLEVVGFWTPSYLEDKLRSYRAAALDRLILCIDADRACGDGNVPAGARVVRYRRRVDAGDVVRVLREE